MMVPIKGFSSYFVNKNGGIFTTHHTACSARWKQYKPTPLHAVVQFDGGNGYQYVNINASNSRRYVKIGVHTVVLTTFKGKPKNGQQARHLDGNKKNNKLSNLKWGTAQENADDRHRHGHTARGSKSGAAKLTWKDVRIIRKMRKSGHKYLTIARRFKVTQSNVKAIAHNYTWKEELRATHHKGKR